MKNLMKKSCFIFLMPFFIIVLKVNFLETVKVQDSNFIIDENGMLTLSYENKDITTLYVHKNSTTEAYADKYGYKFLELSEDTNFFYKKFFFTFPSVIQKILDYR